MPLPASPGVVEPAEVEHIGHTAGQGQHRTRPSWPSGKRGTGNASPRQEVVVW